MSPTESAPYRQPLEAVLQALSTDAKAGLSIAEANAGLKRYGRNELVAEKALPAWRRLLAQFQDPLVILLLTLVHVLAQNIHSN